MTQLCNSTLGIWDPTVAKKEQRVDNVGVGAAAVFLPMVVVVAAAATRGRLEVAAAAANNIIISVSLSLRPKKDEWNTFYLPRYDIIYYLCSWEWQQFS